MRNQIQEKIHAFLNKYAWSARLLHILERTPQHALHWYALLIIGLCIMVVNVGLAWMAFIGANRESVYGAANQVEATTIQRDDLEKVLETYQTKTAAFEAQKTQTPDVIDPGR